MGSLRIPSVLRSQLIGERISSKNLAPYTAGSEVPFEGRLTVEEKNPKKTTIWVYPGSIPIFSALLWSIRTMSTFDMWSKKNIIPLLLLSTPSIEPSPPQTWPTEGKRALTPIVVYLQEIQQQWQRSKNGTACCLTNYNFCLSTE